jgi:hypothetical protein
LADAVVARNNQALLWHRNKRYRLGIGSFNAIGGE